MTSLIPRQQILGVILAGGKASRMNFRDKALLPLAGASLVEHVVAAAAPQVDSLVLSVNRHPEKYAHLGLPLIPDSEAPYAGPLAGIHSAMVWARSQPLNPYTCLATFPADVPWFPGDIVSRLAAELASADCQVAWSQCDAQLQPLFALWRMETADFIGTQLKAGLYGPKLVIPKLRQALVEFPASDPRQFFNINSSAALATAQKLSKLAP